MRQTIWFKPIFYCFATVAIGVIACPILRAQTPAGMPPENAPSAPEALPGDAPLPGLDVQLSVGAKPATGPKPKPKPLPPPPSVGAPLDLMMEAAQTAIQTCLAAGFRVGVAVTDETGQLRVGLSANSTAPGRVYTAVRKDVTAVTFGMPSSEARVRLLTDPALRARFKPNMVIFPGAIPLMAANRLVGALAASGASTSDQDEMCAQAGVDRIQDRLSSEVK